MDKAYDQCNNLVYAKDLDDTYKGTKFKCYNPKCNGEFLFKGSKSNYRTNYFYYDSRHHDKNDDSLAKHIDKCWCLSSNNTSSYESESFDLDTFISTLNTSAPNSTTKTPPPSITTIDTSGNTSTNSAPIKINTLLRLYRFCSSSDPESYIGNKKVKDLYIYSETLDYYKSNLRDSNDYHLFLLDRVITKADYQNYSFQAKCSISDYNFSLFTIKFSDKSMFETAYKSFFKNKSKQDLADFKTEFLILAQPGECTPIGNTSYVNQTLNIDSLKFIHILN
ncbi:hypothetical protein FDB25_07560 [Clostridium botulinum]|nr:hypothetical protein [Clostridium botulinum]